MFERIEHPDVPYSRGRERTTLDPSLATASIECRITGSIQKTSGSTNDAAVFTDHLQRLADFALTLDNDLTLIDSDVPLRYLYELHRLNVSEVRSRAEVTASDINAGTEVDFDISFALHGLRRYLQGFRGSKPCFWPAFDGRWAPRPQDGLFLYTRWEREAVNSSSDDGTAAILSAGSDTYEFTETPTLEVSQVVFPQTAPVPLLPVVQRFTSETYSSADGRFEIPFRNSDPFTLMLLTQLEGDDEELVETEADLFSNLYLGSSSRGGGGRAIYDEAERWGLEAEAIHQFLAYHGQSGTEASPGHFPILVAEGGKITERVNPADFNSFLARIDTPAPGSSPGRFSITQDVLESTDWTLL